MSSRSKYIIIGLLIGLILFLSGCSSLDEPITAESTGFWSKYFVYPMSQLITFFAELVSNYGLAIVIVTLIIRLLLLLLNVKQIRSSIAMQKIQHELQELLICFTINVKSNKRMIKYRKSTRLNYSH